MARPPISKKKKAKMAANFILKSNILALDMAEHTGVYSQQFKGMWHFPKTGKQPKSYGTDYQRETYFINKVADFIRTNDIKIVIAEDLLWSDRSYKANEQLSFYHWGLVLACQICSIREPYFVKPRNLKYFATRKPFAEKKYMIEACIKYRWNTNPVDDNEADATCLYFYALHYLPKRGININFQK